MWLWNYIGETSNRLRLRLNNHKSIRDYLHQCCRPLTSTSVNNTDDGGAWMVAMRGEDMSDRWHAPNSRWSSSYQAEKSPMVRAISWLDEYEDWQPALVLCDSKSLFETLANSNQPDGDVHRIQSAIAELWKKKEVRLLWVAGHCNLCGNELADLEAKLGSEVGQPSVPLDSSTRAALIRREERQSSITNPRLTALYTTRPRDEEEALLQKADRTDLIRFRCGHNPHLRHWQHMTGMSETDSCRQCAEEEESSKHQWLRCPAFIAVRQRLGLGRTFDELVRLPCTSLALLRIIISRLWWLHDNNNNNNTEIWRKKLSDVFMYFYFHTYRQYTTEEGFMSVRKPWSFYYRLIGLKCHNYALNLSFVHIYICS